MITARFAAIALALALVGPMPVSAVQVDPVFRDGFEDRRFLDCEHCPPMVMIPAGTFVQGSPVEEAQSNDAERPQRSVEMAAFAVSRTAITFDQWDACVTDDGCAHAPDDHGMGRGTRPVVDISWDDARQYLAWLRNKTGRDYRLLSESEWEYVTRAGTGTRYHTGNCISADQANFNGQIPAKDCPSGNHREQTLPVASFEANGFGLYDTHGNVAEWLADCKNVTYEGAPTDGSAWADGDCSQAVIRGGSWANGGGALRSAARAWAPHQARSNAVGVRVARSVMTWPLSAGSIPQGWYDTLEDTDSGERIIEFAGENPDDYFRIKVNTSIVSGNTASEANQIFIGVQPTGNQFGYPTSNTGFDFQIDWGDGTVVHLSDSDRTQIEGSNREGFLHTYDAPDVYEITMIGEIPYWSAEPDSAKWLEISNWGTQELKGTKRFLSQTRNLQIVGDALKFPPVTPNVLRWHRSFQFSGSDYHPAYDTGSALLLDRMFYGAKLKRAPFLDTGMARNFHNFFRSATELEGPIPHYNTSNGEFFYRFFRNARKLRTEDIPPLDTSQGRVFEAMFADLPLVTRIPDGYNFSMAGEPFSHPEWVPYGSHSNMPVSALNLFAAGHTHKWGIAQTGADSGLAVIGNLDFNTPANMAYAFHRNSGIKVVSGMDITLGTGVGLFQESAIEHVEGTIRRHPEGFSFGNLGNAFAMCKNLESAELYLPGWTILEGMFSGSAPRQLVLRAPDFENDFNALVPDVSVLESLALPDWPSYVDFSIRDSAMDRDAIMALIESLPSRTSPVTIFIAGAAGAEAITAQDLETAAAKNWILSFEPPN